MYDSIGEEAFKGCNALTSVTMPAVKRIGDWAFVGCISLREIHTNNKDIYPRIIECLRESEIPKGQVTIGNENENFTSKGTCTLL